jgi:hypothetical protein
MVRPRIQPKTRRRATAAPNPDAGWRELRWLESDPPELRQYRGEWVGILGEQIIASGPNASHVYGRMKERGLADVLIVFVEEQFDGHFIG